MSKGQQRPGHGNSWEVLVRHRLENHEPQVGGPDSLQAPPEAGAGGGSPLSSRARARAHVGVTFQLAGEKRRAPALALLINL